MKKEQSFKKNDKGFSLVELIVVIAIMAVFIGILAPQFIGWVAKSKKSTDLQNAQSMATELAVQIAEDDNVTAVAWTEITEEDGDYNVKKLPTVKWKKDFSYWYMVDADGTVHVAIEKEAPTGTDDTHDVYPNMGKNSSYQ